MDIVEQLFEEAQDDPESIYWVAAQELSDLRSFKMACDGQDAVAEVYGQCVSGFTDVIDLTRYSNDRLNRMEKLYRRPDPEAAQLRLQVAKLTEQRDLAVTALNAVKTVMNRSEGIAGWHLNGNVATWYEVLPEVDDAIAAIKSSEIKE